MSLLKLCGYIWLNSSINFCIMLYRIFKGTSAALATSLTLATMANSAQALITPGVTIDLGSDEIDLVFLLDDATEDTVAVQDILDWRATITTGGGDTFKLIGPLGTFGPGIPSTITTPTPPPDPTPIPIFTFDNGALTIVPGTDTFCISDNPLDLCGNTVIGTGSSNTFGFNPTTAGFPLPGFAYLNTDVFVTPLNAPSVLPVTATQVPFDVSPNLGLLALGGIWGISRLRNRKKASKLISEE